MIGENRFLLSGEILGDLVLLKEHVCFDGELVGKVGGCCGSVVFVTSKNARFLLMKCQTQESACKGSSCLQGEELDVFLEDQSNAENEDTETGSKEKV